MPIIMLPNTNTHNLTQVTHRLIIVFVLLCTLIYNKQIIVMEILLFWLPGRVAGPEVGPGRKWQGLGPALSIASAATAKASMSMPPSANRNNSRQPDYLSYYQRGVTGVETPQNCDFLDFY